jgi:hypothetical protein
MALHWRQQTTTSRTYPSMNSCRLERVSMNLILIKTNGLFPFRIDVIAAEVRANCAKFLSSWEIIGSHLVA